jgi:hypothetical protein
MPSYWLKLYTEILDDPKLAEVPDWAKWCFVEFLCLAKENEKGGELQPVTKMAWRLRKTAKQVEATLRTLEEAGVVHTTGATWFVTNFAKRQALSESAERVRRFREKQKEEKKKNVPVTVISYSNVSSSSSSSSSSLPLDSDSLDSSDSFTAAQTANAVSAFNNNGHVRSCEQLYQRVTGQISIPSTSQAQALADIQTVLDHYGKAWDRAVEEGKEIFAAWCNTTGKSGRNYSPTNTAWLGKWLEKIAPVPDAIQNTVAGIAERIKRDAIAASKAR